MKKLSAKQRQLFNEIDKILWEDWDPIGVNDIEEARDEYQSYTPHIFSLVIQGADKVKIKKHLSQLEKNDMGFGSSNNENIEKVVDKILNLIK